MNFILSSFWSRLFNICCSVFSNSKFTFFFRCFVWSKCNHLLATLQLSRNSGISSLNWDLIIWSIFLVSILLITTLPVLGAGITVLFLIWTTIRVFGFNWISGWFWRRSSRFSTFILIFWSSRGLCYCITSFWNCFYVLESIRLAPTQVIWEWCRLYFLLDL